ncbi:hypothetical protein [Streptomyces sp. AK02-04a]|uniref:hypothetical protein n=1 Tax=Streptomyces sp. AK02-04a TaxID=3028649 RepID=UPI0029A727E5|nr:hypothetical protein [Streptomyces sp. AK02-04a]MDX3759333.1 hypothetical protein [Streptomyces sp. AK02-04a]
MTTGNEPPLPAEPPTPPGRPRDARGNFTPTQAAADKATTAARLKTDNPRMTYQQIADAVGYRSKGDAWRAIDKCRKAVLQAAGAELIAAEAAQLDDMFVAAMEVLERDHPVVSHGRVITMADPETQVEKPLLDDGPKLAALREMRAIRESYRKLLGIDQPTQVAVSGSVKYEVVGVDAADLK